MRSFLLLAFLERLIAGQAAADSLADCGQVCELDALGQRLTYPGVVVTSTVIATTVSVNVYQDIRGSIIAQTSTTTANLATPTWEVSGVTLTYPTTYVIYTDLVRSFVATDNGACSTGSAPLDLGPSTDFASLIFPASEVSSAVPPSALVGYLESIPTVLAQLGGSVNSSCDPIAAPTSSGGEQTATLVTTNTQTSVTTFMTTTTVSAAFDTLPGSQLTLTTLTPPFSNASTTSAPPPPPASTTTTSTAAIITSSTVTQGSTTTISSPLSTASASSTSSSLSSASSSATTGTTTIGTETTITSGLTETLTSTTSSSPVSGVTTVTFTGAISSLESSPPGNVTATATSPSSSSIELSNDGNVVYASAGGWLASILGLAVYWL